MLPLRFCWTRFGTESGEDIQSIIARKEAERIATGGMFLWGIGNSVGPAMRDLVRLEVPPIVVFSPMRSKPKAVDVSPTAVMRWTRALDMSGLDWPIPEGVHVTSRQGSEAGKAKRSHYALVCRSTTPLIYCNKHSLRYESLVNLQSQNKLGASQVTAVVEQLKCVSQDNGKEYPVAFTADLVFPYFVRLEAPLDLVPQDTPRKSVKAKLQPSLWAP